MIIIMDLRTDGLCKCGAKEDRGDVFNSNVGPRKCVEATVGCLFEPGRAPRGMNTEGRGVLEAFWEIGQSLMWQPIYQVRWNFCHDSGGPARALALRQCGWSLRHRRARTSAPGTNPCSLRFTFAIV